MTWWFCADQVNAEEYVWIETGRWFDARETAWMILGYKNLLIMTPKVEQPRPPRQAYQDHKVYQVTWEGSAAGLNDLRRKVHRVRIRKMICAHCLGLFWPWDLLEIAGRLKHFVTDNDGISHTCGPVIVRQKKAPEKSPTALPDAQPYEDEKTNGTTSVAPAGRNSLHRAR